MAAKAITRTMDGEFMAVRLSPSKPLVPSAREHMSEMEQVYLYSRAFSEQY